VGRRLPHLLAGALVAALALAAPAAAKDPDRWQLVRVSTIPLEYYQGVTDGPGRELFFSGFLGVWRTDHVLRETGRNPDVMPRAVKDAEGYNHIGDLDFDPGEGGRLLLPLECYYPGTPNGGNTCPQTNAIGTGSIGVADAATLAWRYHVKLDQSEIKKAMWAETTPDGSLWTQDGQDLLRFALADVNPANAAPGGPPIRPVQRLAGAVPPSGITGATFAAGRLFVAGQNAAPGGRLFQVWSIDLADGSRRLEIERTIAGESEGLATIDARDGLLQWQVMPFAPGATPTFGAGAGALLTFAPTGSPQARRPPATWVRPHRQSLAVALRRGIDVAAGCPLPCTLRLRVTAPGRDRTLAATVVRMPRGETVRVRVPVRRGARGEVRRRRALALRATVTDERGRRTLAARGVRLRSGRR
jgi:hypothetical protein